MRRARSRLWIARSRSCLFVQVFPNGRLTIMRGTETTLFAALDVAVGKVIGQCQLRHRHQDFLQSQKKIKTATPAGMKIHLILDNYGTHKHPEVTAWFAERPRYQVHFTPTS